MYPQMAKGFERLQFKLAKKKKKKDTHFFFFFLRKGKYPKTKHRFFLLERFHVLST